MQKQILIIVLLFFSVEIFAQQKDAIPFTAADTAAKEMKTTKDSVRKKKAADTTHSPRKATIRSAIIPGWGQAYNKKYWKIPIVYGALGTAAGFFVYNYKEYVDARDAYRYMRDTFPANDVLIKPKFRPVDPEGVRNYRNGVRQNVDYSVLAFLVLWGLNVVDATVDGHLKAFEVNENLSLKINPSFIPQTKQANVAFVFTFGKKSNTSR
jgi:Family of unknown function (DUF5683)